MHLTQQDIENLPRIRRLNIINSISGVKPANLIGTQSTEGHTNLAIFSSVVHLGSDPALLGFFFRPQHEKPKDTYLNIKSTGFYTINHVHVDKIKNAHYTSAKFLKEVSEFDRCGFSAEYLFGFHAPFVKESMLKIGLEMIDEIPIQANKTILIIGRILHLQLPEAALDQEGNVDLEILQSAGIGGVSTYYTLKKAGRFPYAHLNDVPELTSKPLPAGSKMKNGSTG